MAKLIFKHMYRYWQMKKSQRERLAACLKIQAYYRGRFVRHSSFVNALQLDRYPKIYFLKEQKPIFVKILKSQIPLLTQENMTFDDALDSITEDRRFETIRVEEPDLFEWKPLPLLQLIMPTFGKKTIIRENKSLGLDKAPEEDFTLNDFLFKKPEEKQDVETKLQKLEKRMCHIKQQTLKV